MRHHPRFKFGERNRVGAAEEIPIKPERPASGFEFESRYGSRRGSRQQPIFEPRWILNPFQATRLFRTPPGPPQYYTNSDECANIRHLAPVQETQGSALNRKHQITTDRKRDPVSHVTPRLVATTLVVVILLSLLLIAADVSHANEGRQSHPTNGEIWQREGPFLSGKPSQEANDPDLPVGHSYPATYSFTSEGCANPDDPDYSDITYSVTGAGADFYSPQSWTWEGVECGTSVSHSVVVEAPCGTPDGIYDVEFSVSCSNPDWTCSITGSPYVELNVLTPALSVSISTDRGDYARASL